MKLAAARLAQAEYHLEAVIARRQFLEARCSRGSATSTERDKLAWAIEALPATRETVATLAAEYDEQRRELASLLGPSDASRSADQL